MHLPLPPPKPGTPLYVHFPLCVAKCTYCDFFSVPEEGHDLEALVAALLRESELRGPDRPQTVFFGGGTPSLLPPHLLERLLDGLDARTGFRSSASEVTLECNPESLDARKAERLLDLGVNRLSLGFQSLRPHVLRVFGRVHTVEQSYAAFRAAREAGVQRLSVDLIHSLPGLTAEQWEEDLERVLELGPDHLSAYNLTFEPETPLYHELELGRIQPLQEEEELAQFWATRELTQRAGLTAYEISNFAASGQECRHNINYWKNGAYVGIGPSAASHIEGERFAAPRSIRAWLQRLAVLADDPHSPLGLASREHLSPRERLGETWWLGLRLAVGVDPVAARETAGWHGEDDPAVQTAASLAAQGFLASSGGRWTLTHQGLPLADAVARRFLVSEPTPATPRDRLESMPS